MTNQASEDELRDLVIRVMRYANLLSPRKLNEPVDPMVNYAIGGTVADIKAIIRTEKLKLLAEVRERVVGEDDKQVKNDEDFYDWLVCATCDVILSDETEPKYSCICTRRNDLRVEQRDNLTKLEAEL